MYLVLTPICSKTLATFVADDKHDASTWAWSAGDPLAAPPEVVQAAVTAGSSGLLRLSWENVCLLRGVVDGLMAAAELGLHVPVQASRIWLTEEGKPVVDVWTDANSRWTGRRSHDAKLTRSVALLLMQVVLRLPSAAVERVGCVDFPLDLLMWHSPLVADLLQAMLAPGDCAPTLHQVRAHPFFWPARQQVAFLSLFYAFTYKGEAIEEKIDSPASPRQQEASVFRVALADLRSTLPPDWRRTLADSPETRDLEPVTRDLLKWVRKRWRAIEADEPHGSDEVMTKINIVCPTLLLHCYRLVRGSSVARAHFYDHPIFFDDRRTFEAAPW
jgi:hypothetical protein